jgi:DNA ligase (NAD+)
VEWNPSKRGILVPRIKLKPIKIGGDTITYTTGFNAKYIKDNKIGVGSKLKMIRSGDVIPYIMDVLSHSTNGKPLFPEQRKGKYQWVSSDVGKDSINIELVDKSDSTSVLIKQFANFFSTLKIVGVSEGLITRMVDNGFNTISKICSSTQGDFMILPGIKEKSAQNIYQGIHTVIDNPIKLHQLMAASNCFSGLALKKLKIVVDKYPNIMKIADNKLSIGLIEECDGYSKITSKSFIIGLSKFKEFLTENPFLKYIDPTKHQPSASTSTTNKETQHSSSKRSSSKRKRLFKDVFIVCTGFRDEPMEEQIQEMGATIQSNVNTKTNILVAKDLNVGSSKIKKARELGVTLITYESFKKMIK